MGQLNTHEVIGELFSSMDSPIKEETLGWHQLANKRKIMARMNPFVATGRGVRKLSNQHHRST